MVRARPTYNMQADSDYIGLLSFTVTNFWFGVENVYKPCTLGTRTFSITEFQYAYTFNSDSLTTFHFLLPTVIFRKFESRRHIKRQN